MQLSYSQHREDNFEDSEQEGSKEDESGDSDEEELQSEIITYMIEPTAIDAFISLCQFCRKPTTCTHLYYTCRHVHSSVCLSYTHSPCWDYHVTSIPV